MIDYTRASGSDDRANPILRFDSLIINDTQMKIALFKIATSLSHTPNKGQRRGNEETK